MAQFFEDMKRFINKMNPTIKRVEGYKGEYRKLSTPARQRAIRVLEEHSARQTLKGRTVDELLKAASEVQKEAAKKRTTKKKSPRNKVSPRKKAKK